MAADRVRRELRTAVDEAIGVADAGGALAALRTLWQNDGTLATARFILSRYEKAGIAPRIRTRIGFLRSFTVEPAVTMLEAAAILDGVAVDSYLSGFNAYAQEILDRSSGFYGFLPDIAIVSLQTRDVAPELWERFSSLSARDVEDIVGRVSNELTNLLQTLRSHSQCHIVVQTLDVPPATAYGVLDSRLPASQSGAIQIINQRIRDFCRNQIGTYVLEYDALISRVGRSIGTMRATGSAPGYQSLRQTSEDSLKNGSASSIHYAEESAKCS